MLAARACRPNVARACSRANNRARHSLHHVKVRKTCCTFTTARNGTAILQTMSEGVSAASLGDVVSTPLNHDYGALVPKVSKRPKRSLSSPLQATLCRNLKSIRLSSEPGFFARRQSRTSATVTIRLLWLNCHFQ